MKLSSIAARVTPEIKAALEKAAREDSRTLSNLIEKILTDWLRAASAASPDKDGSK
jgi:hypothetical protein